MITVMTAAAYRVMDVGRLWNNPRADEREKSKDLV
jgi:hypothetical protein